MAATERLCAISVDLDEIHHYFAIHGLAAPGGSVPSLVYDVALRRFSSFSQRNALPLTLFAVGTDLRRPRAVEALRDMHHGGNEIANHSLDHRYDLTRLSHEQMVRQVRGGADAIEGAVGERPVGFRAPGYTVTDELLAIVQQEGAEYDSSVFPCPPYFAAKAAAMLSIRARGRRSHSVLDSPRVLAAPTEPYRLADAYHRRGAGLMELPIQVTPVVRYPFIGTFLTLAGIGWAERLASWVARGTFVSLELHGVDLLDATDGLEALLGHQPDIKIPWRQKQRTIDGVVDVLRRAGFSFVSCRELAGQAQHGAG